MPQKFITEKLIRSSWLITQLEFFLRTGTFFGSFLCTKIYRIKTPNLYKNFGPEAPFAFDVFLFVIKLTLSIKSYRILIINKKNCKAEIVVFK